MTLYKNKYRIESIRKPGWDYSSAGLYFVTICTKWRTNDFGKIVGDKMVLNDYGIIVKDEWERTFKIRKQVTKRIRENGFLRFHWQLRFHDHIIKDENELHRIRNYFKFNPANWIRDTFNANSNMVQEPGTWYEPESWMI